jgi:oxygen-independent coproporphyrinogen-3 oxidase
MDIRLAENRSRLWLDAAAAGESSTGGAELIIDTALIREYGGSGPRYTSYPTADRFVEAFDAAAYRRRLRNRNAGGFARELGLYVHLPFCGTICYYCGCNKIVAKDHGKSAKYVKYLGREARLVAECLGEDRAISQMHWGGGTPTFLADSELAELTRMLRSEFEFAARGEYAIEVDPRTVNSERIALLAQLGFNRISIGVQDFDPEVQRAIHRVQSVEQTEEAVRAARENRFRSVNVDLIYGLPKQTPEGFARTLALVDALNPDRIALYSYAHLPTLFKPQRRIAEADLPAPEIKLQLLTAAIDWFLSKGYVYIGMDHFAKPGDDLAVAKRQGRLTRNFQGYSGTGASDILGLGVSAISTVGPVYAQNAKTLDEYYGRLDSGALPVVRGLEPSADDLVRRAVIQALTCHFEVSTEAIAGAHLIHFEDYFSRELDELKQMEKESLVTVGRERIGVTPRGRLLVRAICAVFDRHLRAGRARASYSKVI